MIKLGVVVLTVAGLLGTATAAATAAVATPAVPSSLATGRNLAAGQLLRSANGRTTLSITPRGQARLVRAGRIVWSTRSAGPGAVLRDAPSGDLLLMRHGRVVWRSGTHGAGRARLTVGDGTMTLTTASGTVWSNLLGNGCTHVRARHAVLVDISRQRAWLCAGRQQILTTPVTTGATQRGDGTPTGTWQVYSKQRNTTLYPAAGGAYPVHYWMPYNGAYGLHDAPWQRFAFGSKRYRKDGSHGCVHVPEAAMRQLFDWAPVGTTVTIRR